jgi:hypothetical protein
MVGPQPRAVVRRWRRAPAVGLVVLAVAAAAVVVPATSAPPVGAIDPEPWSVVAKPVTSLTDGQGVVINVKTTTPDFPIYTAEVHVCRSGITYQPSTDDRPNVDFKLAGDNCPLTPISSSADSSITASTYNLAPTEGGATLQFAVGTGVVKWTSTQGGEKKLTCDSANPCTLVVELNAGNPATWIPWTQQLTYQVDDPVAGCGGPADGALESGASDRMADAWVNWTLEACRKPGQTGALTTASFPSEGDAVQNFSTGKLDLAYSAAGYNPAVNLAPDNPEPHRAVVSLPVAVNATVFAVGNGQPGPGGHKIPYTSPKLTLDEVAAMVSGGQFGLSPAQEQAIAARNPEFDPTKGGTTLFVKVGSGYPVQGPAESESSSWVGTDYLTQLTPAAWRVPNLPLFGTDAGKPRGADAILAQAAPSYALALGLFSGRPSLKKTLHSFGSFDFGGLWALTDLATATALGLTPVSIQNASGEFVAPTPASLDAAVATMVPQSDGMLLPNPTATAPVGQPQPYPLTFVEYAMAPTQALVDASGCARTKSQTLLATWLSYVTGTGQAQLPAGMSPLTPALAATAAQAIPRVGSTPSTSTCAPPSPTPDATQSPTGAGGSAYSRSGSGDASGAYASAASSAGSDPAAAGSAADPAQAELAASTTPVPDYGGNSPASGLIGVATMLGIVFLVFGAAALSSGRGRGLFRSDGDPPS